jgi:hypothetical protein
MTARDFERLTMAEVSLFQTRTIVLLGTSHKYQLPGHAAEGEFRSLVVQAAASAKVRAIAEEMSQEALAQKHAAQSICEEIANVAGLAHRYCDPDNEQRSARNIQDAQKIRLDGFYCDWSPERIEQEVAVSHSIRERYWFTQLSFLDIWPTLFICGADHIDGFCLMLEEKGFHVEIAVRDWSPG